MAATTKSKNIIMAPIKDMVSKNDNTRILHGGTVVEVTNSKQAKHAEQAGACAVLVIDPISYSSSSKNYMITASLINNIKEIEKAVPADGVKMMSMGFDGVFLDPKNLPWFGRDKHVKSIIDAVRHHDRKGDI
ncbi:hypothetical protein FEM48_Zijuj09G0190600 [Ziziphus jujuba var. spinosa]|uniref:PdxS/SNZ N-terminal domain-containing protein n=1 Tax=Ziziphus jujuba var. spinosa TaxID=714518 RepID=A0A978UUR8_ZIZJJ|nr:hypothetical protein FEM48_Zijuj09G0190300 [Ziziphus jujuba var. spinosa]KAH7518621.1 hypothetical protein FEM48_Zijuj09G0190600 [Ziziphus jujuba var. spinosa]